MKEAQRKQKEAEDAHQALEQPPDATGDKESADIPEELDPEDDDVGYLESLEVRSALLLLASALSPGTS